MTQENYSDRMKDYGRTDIKGSGARKVAPIVINLPQDDSGAWMRDELTRYATEGRMSISALGRRALIQYVDQNKQPDDQGGGRENYIDGR